MNSDSGTTFAWNDADIDGYLAALSRFTSPRIGARWKQFCSAAIDQSSLTEGNAWHAAWDRVFELGPDAFTQFLCSDTDAAKVLRMHAPFYAISTDDERREVLRSFATSRASNRSEWQRRWKDEPAEGNSIDLLVNHIYSAMGDDMAMFQRFLCATGNRKWMIAADFCIGDPSRAGDVFAFTVFPYDAPFPDLCAEISSIFPKDIKKTKIIEPSMTEYLRLGRRFHFAFIVQRPRKLLAHVDDARQSIDRTIAQAKAYRDAPDHLDEIAALERLRRMADANSFNFSLFQDIILTAAFAGFIAMLIQLEGRGLLISFMPDRDKITEAYEQLAYRSFAMNASAFALRHRVPEAQIAFALPGPRSDGKPGIYFDELVRVPDYIAGAVSSTDFSGPISMSLATKHADIITKSLADNPSFLLFRIGLPPHAISASRILLSSTPLTR